LALIRKPRREPSFAAPGIQLRIAFEDPLSKEAISPPFQEAPGGNPGTPGMKTIPLSMPHGGT
jgi:hypothetical protein